MNPAVSVVLLRSLPAAFVSAAEAYESPKEEVK